MNKVTVTKCKLPREDKSLLEETFFLQWRLHFGSQHRSTTPPMMQREYRFDAERDWRFDFAIPKYRIAVECEGGTWSGGRHTRGKGFEADCSKYSAAALQGWMVGRFTGSQVKSGAALEWVKRALLERAK